MIKMRPRADRNLIIGSRVDKKFQKCNLERTKLRRWDLESVGSPRSSSSGRGDLSACFTLIFNRLKMGKVSDPILDS